MTMVYCTSCGARLQDNEENRIRFCPYCGSSLFGVNINERREFIYRKIDESEIKKEEYRTYIRKTELEHDIFKNKALFLFLGIYTMILLVVIILAVIATVNDSENSRYIWFLVGIMISMPIMIFLTSLLLKKDDPQAAKKPVKSILLLWGSYLALAGIIFLVISGSEEIIYTILAVGLVVFELTIVYKSEKNDSSRGR